MTAEEVIGWLRVVRPGSIIGPQQQFMKGKCFVLAWWVVMGVILTCVVRLLKLKQTAL